MKTFPRWPLGLALSSLLAASALAGDDKAVAPTPASAPDNGVGLTRPALHLPPFEFDYVESYVGSADVRRGGKDDAVDEHYTLIRTIFTPRTPLGVLRLGAEWERFSFGLGHNSPVPNTLQAIKLVLGLDTQIGNSILLRAEVQPGFYGAHFTRVHTGDFSIPFVVGGTYIYNPDLQFVLGFDVDLNRKFPLLPAAGVRWKFAPHLLLDAVLPEPRLEYEVARGTTAYVGADLQGGSFRVSRRFGSTRRKPDPTLNRAVVTFSEIRTGVGLEQKLPGSLTLSIEGGCQVYREFDFYRADARYHGDGPAAYGQLSLHAAF